jgi:hypothetical protein
MPLIEGETLRGRLDRERHSLETALMPAFDSINAGLTAGSRAVCSMSPDQTD